MISIKSTTKATSAVAIVALVVAMLFGTWILTPMQVDAAQYEENATTSNVTVKNYVSCGMPASWADGVEFGALDPGTSDNLPLDQNYTMIAPSTNNVPIDFWIKANAPLTKGADTIPLQNYTWNMTKWEDSPPPFASTVGLTTSYVEGDQCNNTQPGANCTLHLWLDIPLNQAPGTYNNTLIVKCNQSS